MMLKLFYGKNSVGMGDDSHKAIYNKFYHFFSFIIKKLRWTPEIPKVLIAL